MESFGWKNLFEELIHNFGDVMSTRTEQEKFKYQPTEAEKYTIQTKTNKHRGK